MKVLWFAVTPSLYDKNNTMHNGGGWIASLESLVREIEHVELGIAFEHSDKCFRVKRDNVSYYPISSLQSKYNRLRRRFFFRTEENQLIPDCLKVISDFKPDIIHIFGSEWCFGLVAQYTKTPVVIHIQGSIPPYYNARFPVGYNETDYIRYYGFNLKQTLLILNSDWNFKLNVKREERILRGCQYYMGRTEWDKNLTQLYSPLSKYFYCSEALRESFVKTENIWKIHNRKRIILTSTISSPLYKGSDVILKTAKILKENTKIEFEWRVFGVNELQFHEWKTKIKASEVSVILKGTVSDDRLKDELIDADIFIHPSYIDNSPNSVCEAQLLGMPVISTNVGGISSLVKHYETGFLIPSNDPYSIASYIILLCNEKNIAALIGQKARIAAIKRHDPKKIIADLISIYNKVIEYEK